MLQEFDTSKPRGSSLSQVILGHIKLGMKTDPQACLDQLSRAFSPLSTSPPWLIHLQTRIPNMPVQPANHRLCGGLLRIFEGEARSGVLDLCRFPLSFGVDVVHQGTKWISFFDQSFFPR